MSLAALCRHPLVAIDHAATLADAARLMRAEHVGALVVTERDPAGHQHVLGLVTDRDLAVEVMARDLPAPRVEVGALTRGAVVTVAESASLGQAAQAMRSAGVRRLLVVDAQQSLVGLVSADDLLEAMAAELTELAQALRSGLLRETHERSALPARAHPATVPERPVPVSPRVVFRAYGTPALPADPITADGAGGEG